MKAGPHRGGLPQQLQRIHVDRRGEPLKASQGEVALTALQSAHVGAVDPDQVGEGLLGEAALQPVAAQVCTDGPLEVAFHPLNGSGPLLVGLQTYT